MEYILKASNQAFIILKNNKDLIITPDYTKATKFSVIGEAIKAAAEVNDALETHLIKVISL